MSDIRNGGAGEDPQRRERFRRVRKTYLIVLALGVAYVIFTLATGWGIPCPFYTVTHLQCPACGVSRMILSLLRLDFAAAWSYNPYLLINGPIIVGCLIASDIRYIQTGAHTERTLSILLWIEVALALAFGVLRNLI